MNFKNKYKTLYLISILVLLFQCKQKKDPVDIDWVMVEGGEFTMGMNEPLISPGRDTIYGYTTPEHKVQVSDFLISRYEITVDQYRIYCEQNNLTMPTPPAISPYGDSINYQWQNGYPMLVTWNEAANFAKWAGGRLPTEAEWEYAAKGGNKSKGFAYSGSDTASVVGWVRENSDSTFHPVGQLKPNELGIYDMTGNLNEWVSDWWDPEFDYNNSATLNPTGPDSGQLKISKGVGWYYGAADDLTGTPLKYSIQRSEVRYQSGVDERTYGFGFRIVKDL